MSLLHRAQAIKASFALPASLSLHAWACVSKRCGNESILRYMRQASMGFFTFYTKGFITFTAVSPILA